MVDNGFRIYKYNGKLIYEEKKDRLYQVCYRPNLKGTYPTRSPSPDSRGPPPPSSNVIKRTRYVPPHLRQGSNVNAPSASPPPQQQQPRRNPPKPSKKANQLQQLQSQQNAQQQFQSMNESEVEPTQNTNIDQANQTTIASDKSNNPNKKANVVKKKNKNQPGLDDDDCVAWPRGQKYPTQQPTQQPTQSSAEQTLTSANSSEQQKIEGNNVNGGTKRKRKRAKKKIANQSQDQNQVQQLDDNSDEDQEQGEENVIDQPQ